jgi:hypothetical protein
VTRLSFAEARRLNIDERIIRMAEQHAAQAERSEAARERLEVEPPKPKRAKRDDGYDSKLERDFADVLVIAKSRTLITEWWHHPFRFRLAPTCYFQPDFLVDTQANEWHEPLTLIEVKGGWFRDDAKVKAKVAAELFPCFRWLIVYREKQHGWDVREVDHRGIGREPVRIPWIQ